MEQAPLPLGQAPDSIPQAPASSPEPRSIHAEPNAYERMETFLAEREKLDYLPKLSQQTEIAAPT